MRARSLLCVAVVAGLAAYVVSSRARAAAVEEGELVANQSTFGNVFDSLGEALGLGGSMRTSPEGIEAMKREEGFSATLYHDEAGVPTIGHGHRVRPGERFLEPMSEATAEALLAQDLASAERAVNQAVSQELAQEQFDALVSFAFNVGNAAFRTSTLLSKLNDGDFQGAAAEFGRWRYVTVGGLKVASRVLEARREREAELFARADYGRAAV